MKNIQERLGKAFEYAMGSRPAVGGFPYLAECLRVAGVQTNVWTLPAAQSVYNFAEGSLVNTGTPLATGMVAVPPFDQEALIRALRTDQAGQSSFPEFLLATWHSGVTSYTVDFAARTVAYSGAQGEVYTESYPVVDIGVVDFGA